MKTRQSKVLLPRQPLQENLNGKLSGLQAHHIAELTLVWAADKRLPTVTSRRTWAAARGVDAAAVHRWFQKQRYREGRQNGGKLLAGSYDLVVEVGETNAGPPAQVKQERATSPVLRPKSKTTQILSTALKAVRHIRAHDTNPNPLCSTCSQLYLDSAAAKAPPPYHVLELPKDDLRVKRERAASPELTVTKKHRTEAEAAVVVKEEDSVPAPKTTRARRVPDVNAKTIVCTMAIRSICIAHFPIGLFATWSDKNRYQIGSAYSSARHASSF